MDIFLLHLTFGILLFLIINWIGKHSYSIGYIEISIFVKTEEAPALNFLIRVLTPIVFLILISTLLYSLKLDKYVTNIYLVNLYYILFRLFFNLITNRGRLLNWYRQSIYWAAILIISFVTYDKLIKVKTNILPDFSTVANELWIIILIFLFQITNNVRLSKTGTERRKLNYLKVRFKKLKNKFGDVIQDITKNQILEALTYSIIIYEDFNRPRVIRFLENFNFKITKKPHTLGIMQVLSSKLLTDHESVLLGTKKIVESYSAYVEEVKNNPTFYSEYVVFDFIVSKYNGGESYNHEIYRLFSTIKETFFKDTKDSLEPTW